MEKDDEVKGSSNHLDFGARCYDPRVGRFLSLDPMAHIYANLNPYNFVGNTPLNAIDPDGRVIIIINGYNTEGLVAPILLGGVTPGWSTGVKGIASEVIGMAENVYDLSTLSDGAVASPYWQGFDVGATKKWNDFTVKYVDGSPGLIIENESDDYRIKQGKAQGLADAKGIRDNLSDGETIKIVTHSMGGAFGRGYVEGLQEGLQKLVDEHNTLIENEQAKQYIGATYDVQLANSQLWTVPEIEIVVDIAPYSEDKKGHKAVDGVPTYQMSGDKDGLSGNNLWEGANPVDTKKGTGHSIDQYDANDLPEVKKQ